MSSGPDLFLVCKSCGAEVSPYITECPYCGTRIQKRAPKLDRGGVSRGARRGRSRPQLPRLRPNEIPGFWVPLLTFFACGAGGAWIGVNLGDSTWAYGANGAALGLLAAWSMRDIL